MDQLNHKLKNFGAYEEEEEQVGQRLLVTLCLRIRGTRILEIEFSLDDSIFEEFYESGQ